jgi:hypothetical protein
MTNADIPYMISDALMGVSENPVVILLLINIVLLIAQILSNGQKYRRENQHRWGHIHKNADD